MNKVIFKAINVKKTKQKNLNTQEKLLYFMAVLSGLGLLGAIVSAITIVFVFTAFSSTLPSPTRLTNRNIDQSTKIYDRNGDLLYSAFDVKNRTLINLGDVSPFLINATLATEDADFYRHEGLDLLGIARGILVTVTGRGKQGGSTLTQQVAKNALLSPERTVKRKIKDMVLALQIEKSYAKDDILQMYINEVPYGGTTWGIEAASKTFFNKSARDLTLAQSALLAGLPQAPTRYSPFSDPEAAKNRQKYVLWLMKDKGWVDMYGKQQYLSENAYEQAISEPLEYASFQGSIRAPHFVMHVLSQLRDRYGTDMVERGGLVVTTSLDLQLQEKYQQIVSNEVEKSKDRYGFTNAGLVAIDPKTHQILAMVGSKDFFADDIDGQFNVTLGHRQPGSALKPFTYLTGLTQGYTASTVLYDVYTEFDQGPGLKPYAPQNYGNWGFRGPIQVRYALGNSVNVPAVKMLDLVGIPNMVRLANDLGVKSLHYDPSKNGLALTLGGGEVTLLDLTHGFASLADGGRYKDITLTLKVTDNKGKILEQYADFEGKEIVDKRYVWIITDILSDNGARIAAFGGNSLLHIPGQKVAVKTGTSNDLKDNWAVGFTRDIAIGVWVGNNDGTKMNTNVASGLTGASPIWNRAMTDWLSTHPHQEFSRPEGIVEMKVGSFSGMVPYENQEDRRIEYYVEGSQPKTKSEIYKRVKICKDGEVKDSLYIEYTANKKEWQPWVEAWIKERYKDDESELYKYMGPDYNKEKDKDKFDIDNCKKKEKSD